MQKWLFGTTAVAVTLCGVRMLLHMGVGFVTYHRTGNRVVCESYWWPPLRLNLTDLRPGRELEERKGDAAANETWTLELERCGESWTSEYAKWHRGAIRDGMPTRGVFIWSAGTGGVADWFEGSMATAVLAAFTGHVVVFNWTPLQAVTVQKDFRSDLLPQLFVPTNVQWNLTSHESWESGRTHRGNSLDDFVREYMPIGIRGALDAAKSADLEKLVAAHWAFKSATLLADSWKKVRWTPLREFPQSLGLPAVTNVKVFGLSPVSYMSLKNVVNSPPVTNWTGKEIHGEILHYYRLLGQKNRTERAEIDANLGSCTFRWLFNKPAPLLTARYGELLQKIVDSYTSLPVDNSEFRRMPLAEGRNRDCAGQSFSQCIQQQMGIFTNPIVGLYFRVRNVERHRARQGSHAERFPLSVFPEALGCVRNLANSLNFKNVTLMLITDCMDFAEELVELGRREHMTVLAPRFDYTATVASEVDTMASVLTLASSDAMVVPQSRLARLAWYSSGLSRKHVALFGQNACELGTTPDL